MVSMGLERGQKLGSFLKGLGPSSTGGNRSREGSWFDEHLVDVAELYFCMTIKSGDASEMCLYSCKLLQIHWAVVRVTIFHGHPLCNTRAWTDCSDSPSIRLSGGQLGTPTIY